MTRRLLEDMSVVAASVRYRDLAYLVLSDDGIDPGIGHSHIFSWDLQDDPDDPWGYAGATYWTTVDMAISRHPLQQMIAISPHGEARLFGSHDERDERIVAADGDPLERGHLRAVRTIGEHTFVAGMGRQVYRRDAVDRWVCLDRTIRPAVGETKGFEGIDGVHEEDVYAVGWDGEIWHWDGAAWRQQPGPTTHVLTGVRCGSDGQVHAWGRRGLIVTGRGADWRLLPQDPLVGDIRDMAWHDGDLYVATGSALYTLVDGTLQPVGFGDDVPTGFGRLSVSDGMLWSIGPKDIMAHEDGRWRRIA